MTEAARDSEYSRRVAAVFDLVAPGYDSPALRFFPFVADRLIARVNPRRGEKILDVIKRFERNTRITDDLSIAVVKRNA